ncbi:MAG: NUDIX domain-containing protein [Mycobacteriales bacterium]
MTPRLPSSIQRLGLSAFRRLPAPIRRRAIHAGTPNFTVGAVLIMRDDAGRILLVRQRHTTGWGLPGGLLAHGEAPEDAVRREVSEELGLQIDPAEVTPAVPHAMVNPKSRRVDIVFMTTSTATVTPDGTEILEARWFPTDDLPVCSYGTRPLLIRCGVVPSPA